MFQLPEEKYSDLFFGDDRVTLEESLKKEIKESLPKKLKSFAFNQERTIHLVFAFTTVLLLNPVSGQSPNSFIEELCGVRWAGHYQHSEDSSLLHILQWSFELDGKVIRSVKSVPELEFLMETSIYYDFEHNCYSSLTLINKSMISKGMVTMDDNHLLIKGRSYFEDGSREFRIEYSLNDNGQLEDRF